MFQAHSATSNQSSLNHRRASDPVRTLDRNFGIEPQLNSSNRSGSCNQISNANIPPVHGHEIRNGETQGYFPGGHSEKQAVVGYGVQAPTPSAFNGYQMPYTSNEDPMQGHFIQQPRDSWSESHMQQSSANHSRMYYNHFNNQAAAVAAVAAAAAVNGFCTPQHWPSGHQGWNGWPQGMTSSQGHSLSDASKHSSDYHKVFPYWNNAPQ